MAEAVTAHDAAPAEPKLYGVLAEFPDVPSVYLAAQACRDAGFKRWDVYAPFPIHNINEAMGLRPSRVSAFVLGGAIVGAGGGFLLQAWTSGVAYPLITAGKPFVAWEQFTPVTFELGVLIAAFGALVSMFLLNGLPRHYHPLLKKERFLSASDDGFFIAIEAADENFDRQRTAELLESLGATSVETVEE